jgi:predicted Rossmann fold nucleotide-binding protein DprA/Smf involved in DNA uptake
VNRFPADWNKHGRGAGMIRNRLMAHNADALIAVWDGVSSGTDNMISLAKVRGLKVFVYITSTKKIEEYKQDDDTR